MSFKDKMKLFFENFFSENKGVLITILFILILSMFSKYNTVKATSEYTEVEYITTSNYIVTDYTPTTNTRVILDYLCSGSINSWGNVLSTSNINATSNPCRILIQNTYGSDNYTYYFGSDKYAVGCKMPINTRYVVDINKNSLFINGELKGTATYNNWICENEHYIALNTGSGTGYFCSSFTVYSLKIYENDVLVRDYVPMLNNNTGYYGLYDTINNNFITSSSNTGGESVMPSLNLSVSTTETTDLPVLIKTQTFSQDFLNSHKCYVSYEKDSNGRTWYLADVSDEGYYYINALTNGSYVFKLEDLEGNVLSTNTMNITNIIRNTEDTIICPILSVSKTDLGTVRVRTQSFNLTGIARYDCFYWLRSQQGSFETKMKLQPTIVSEDNGHSFYYCYELSEDDTIFFTFYDKSLNKYSNNVSLTVDIDYVLNNSIYDLETTEKSLSDLLKQKFGIFYFAVDFLKEFWNVLTSEDVEPPNFSFTMPDFLGGGTFDIFNLEIYDKYKDYIHYILAGFCYFFYIKKMTKVIPNLISDISN